MAIHLGLSARTPQPPSRNCSHGRTSCLPQSRRTANKRPWTRPRLWAIVVSLSLCLLIYELGCSHSGERNERLKTLETLETLEKRLKCEVRRQKSSTSVTLTVSSTLRERVEVTFSHGSS
jgi:hypothetical protein